jgi:thiamine-monophosphate kinase
VTGVRLAAGREFDVVRTILADATDPAVLEVGPGDDGAVLARDARVVSTDMMVEGVHFRREWLEAREVGYRAVMAAVSDMAAMGADPVAVLVSLAASSEDAASGYLAEVGRGTRAAAGDVGAVLAGGDVTRSTGPLVVDVVVLGDTRRPVLRSGAQPGDELWVTGSLGGAAAAVRLWEAHLAVPPPLRERFASPRPRVRHMRALQSSGFLTAGLDLSDGLVQDAEHLAVASGVALQIDAHRVPVDPEAVGALGDPGALEAALSGGEDYELLIAARPGLQDHAPELSRDAGAPLTRVGVVVEGVGVHLLDRQGRALAPAVRGFDHFAGQEDG